MPPKIICHMMSSVDGRLYFHRWSPPSPGIDLDILRARYDECAATFSADGWIVGRISMQAYAKGFPRDVPGPLREHVRETYIGNRKGRDLAVVIDPDGKLHYGEDQVAGDHVVAVLGDQVSDAYLSELQADGVSYVLAGSEGIDLHRAIQELGERFGAKTLLLEGGGRTNGTFFNAGLIDEISLLIYPGIDGVAGISSIFEYHGNRDSTRPGRQSLRHLTTETLAGGMVWLRYEVIPSEL